MSKLTKIFSGKEGQKKTSSDEKASVDRPPSRSMARRSIGRSKRPSVATSVKASTNESSGEHEAVKRARKALKPLIEKTTKGKPPISIGLVLAILNQETGNNKAANVLIEEYQLDKVFGLKKF